MKQDFTVRLKTMGRSSTPDTLVLQNCKLANKYIILDLIAIGSRSTIYYGLQESTGEERAFKFYNMKQIQAELDFSDKEVCKRFSNYEYTIMSRCKSTHVLKCLDIYQDRFYKVMVYQYCNMGSLKQQIKRRESKRTDLIRAIVILKQILAALKSLHRDCQIFHKNLKSQNILIKDGIYKIIDFGLPTSINTQQKQNGKDTNFLIPQIVKKISYTQKAQVWSVGILFHQILFGQTPQQLLNPGKSYLISNAVTNIFVEHKFAGLYCQQAIDFLKKCLYTDPEKRMTWGQLQNHSMFALVKYKDFQQKNPINPVNRSQASQERLMSIIFVEENYEKQAECQKSSENINIQNLITPNPQFYDQTFNLQIQKKCIEKQLEKNYERKGEYFLITPFEPISQKYYRNIINTQQHKSYLQLKNYYFQCLKVECILEQIIIPLNKFSDFKTERQNIEFVYLLLSRCFAEMSQIKYFSKGKKNEKNILMTCIKGATSKLYKQIEGLWNLYSDLLRQQQDKTFSMFSDKLSKIFSEKKFQQKDKYLVGIEKVDYNKQHQIEFTQKFYFENVYKGIWELKDKQQLQKDYSLSEVLKYMEIYTKIWQIPFDIIQKYSYLKDYIILMSTMSPSYR